MSTSRAPFDRMVATNARKARRAGAAAAAAAAAGSDAVAHDAPATSPPPPRERPPELATRKTKHISPTTKGTGSKAGGGYTPPAILRAVANAARNKEAKAGGPGGAGGGGTEAAATSAKGDWDCPKCGKSNFGKRLMCFKCGAPKPGRKFTVAGMKGYEKRQQRRAQKAAAEAEAAAGKRGPAGGDEADEAAKKKKPKKTSFDDGDQDADVPATAAGEWAWAGKPGKEAIAASDKVASPPARRKSVKSRDRGKPPKQLRDPNAPLVYLEKWMESRQQLEAAGGEGKPANGWKLDKNIQNWLLHNVFDETAVDEDVFAIMLMYVKGLRGGPLERLREAAREKNKGKGSTCERARAVLRELAGVGDGEDEAKE